MYAVSIRYPRKAGEEFDLEHWANVHMPMGIGIFDKTNGFAPKQVMIQHSTFGLDREAQSTDAYATVWLLFDTQEGVDGFIKLHGDPVKSAPLVEDFANFAPLAPHLSLGQVDIFDDVDAILERAQTLID